ncbi:MAG: response regulator, partial [Anaerolineae bacterium]|nr:response regulator [Anaerolineae bacterium]
MEGKILIVDDDLDTLQLVGTMLEKQGLEIVAAGNGAQAIEVAKRALPDLVLLDIMMPGMDGYEVARQLKSHEPTSTIPIIMFTAKAQVEDKVAGFAAGVDDYLTKPIHPKELVARVKKILSDHKILLPQPPAPATSPPPPQDAATQTPPPPPVMARQPDDTLVSAASAVQAPRSTGQVIGVIGAKGGLGVSTISLNLGISIHQQTGADVLVAEMRPGQGDIGIYLGYPQPEGMNKLLYYKETIVRPSDIEEQWIEHDSGVKLLMTSFFPRD